MAISTTTPTPGKFGWIINSVSANASDCEELKATPGAGKKIIIDHITINNGANAITITIGQGETTGSVTKALIGPISFAVNTSIQWNFPKESLGGMVLDADTSLTVDASGAGAICIFAYGWIE